MTGVEELLPLIIAGAGTAASIYGQHQAAGERRDILNKQLQRTSDAQDKTSAMVVDEGKKYAPTARMDALGAQQAATLAQEQKDLGTAPTIITDAGDSGNVSPDYLAAKADKALTEGNRLSAVARELAKTRGPSQLMSTEGLRRADLTGNLSSIWGSNRAQAGAANLDAQQVGNPWYADLGQVAAAAASAYGAGKGGGAGGGADGAGGMSLQEGEYPYDITGQGVPYQAPVYRAPPSVFGRPGSSAGPFRRPGG